ncbi:MAG: DUF4397 domain-containing protein [Polyangiaceae bacterium]|nr:DUF4397 domain-containing protein [Polyangiaceae bacterium]
MRNSAFVVMCGVALAGASMFSVACVAEESAGAAGASGSAGSVSGGSGGSKAGAGGSTAGAGGSTAGAGGSTAGAGGSTAGAGGSTAGAGGSTAGASGASGAAGAAAGAGGASGAGGAAAGAGGAAAGAGGAAAGAGGAAAGAGGAAAGAGGAAAGAAGAGGAAFSCTPGEYSCAGQALQKCDASGSSVTTEKTCASGEICDAASAKCTAPGTIEPAKGYVRFAQLAPSAAQTAYDVCIRAAGSTNWDTSSSGDATQIFRDAGDPGEFYFPTVSTYFEFPVGGNYEFRFVKGDATNCDTPSTKLPGGAGGFYALNVPAGQVYTLVIYDTDGAGQEKALDIVAFGSQAATSGKATVTWANAMTNVPGLDFGAVEGNQFSDLQLGVAK